MWIIILIFVWRSLKGRCYGNQLNLEDVRIAYIARNDLCNRSDDCEAAFKRFNGSNPVTLCTNLVNFRLSEFTLLKRTIFVVIRPQFDDDLDLSPWRSETDWKITIFISEELAVISVHLVEIW